MNQYTIEAIINAYKPHLLARGYHIDCAQLTHYPYLDFKLEYKNYIISYLFDPGYVHSTIQVTNVIDHLVDEMDKHRVLIDNPLYRALKGIEDVHTED